LKARKRVNRWSWKKEPATNVTGKVRNGSEVEQE
jgi:hypothetical protein